MNRVARSVCLLAVSAAPALWGCGDPSEGEVLTIDAVGSVQAQLIFDANGTGRADAGDQPLSGWTVTLDQPAGGTVATAQTNVSGLALFPEVPVGQWKASVPASRLGDTLSLVPSTVQPFTLRALQVVEVVPVATLPSMKIGEVRLLEPGKPLFTEGIALNTLVQGDRTLHIKAQDRYLRVLTVDSGAATLGDSVRVSGRTMVDQGVPVLDGRSVFRLRASTGQPVAVTLSTGDAAGARGGSLDAALVAVGNADVLEVVSEGDAGVRLVVNDGTGPLTIRFRSFLQVDPRAVNPATDFVGVGAGLLVPNSVGGTVVWELRPRTVSDVLFYRPSG
jgi:hypothetical protein